MFELYVGDEATSRERQETGGENTITTAPMSGSGKSGHRVGRTRDGVTTLCS